MKKPRKEMILWERLDPVSAAGCSSRGVWRRQAWQERVASDTPTGSSCERRRDDDRLADNDGAVVSAIAP